MIKTKHKTWILTLSIILLIVIALIILKKYRMDNFTNVNDEQLQKHIDEVNHFEGKHKSNLLNDLYYYPYNDIFNKYKKSMTTYLCKKKIAVDQKNKLDTEKNIILKKKYQDLKRQISPNFNPIFGDFLQLNTYDSNNNNKITYLKVKRYNDNSFNPPKATFQVFMSGDGNKCLEVDNYNRYKLAKCNSESENQRFTLSYAYDKQSYEDIVKNPKFRFPENPDFINYPITLLRAKNGNCVNIYDDKVSIEPCKYKTTQMFKINPL
jgi:hypothetical protein